MLRHTFSTFRVAKHLAIVLFASIVFVVPLYAFATGDVSSTNQPTTSSDAASKPSNEGFDEVVDSAESQDSSASSSTNVATLAAPQSFATPVTTPAANPAATKASVSFFTYDNSGNKVELPTPEKDGNKTLGTHLYYGMKDVKLTLEPSVDWEVAGVKLVTAKNEVAEHYIEYKSQSPTVVTEGNLVVKNASLKNEKAAIEEDISFKFQITLRDKQNPKKTEELEYFIDPIDRVQFSIGEGFSNRVAIPYGFYPDQYIGTKREEIVKLTLAKSQQRMTPADFKPDFIEGAFDGGLPIKWLPSGESSQSKIDYYPASPGEPFQTVREVSDPANPGKTIPEYLFVWNQLEWFYLWSVDLLDISGVNWLSIYQPGQSAIVPVEFEETPGNYTSAVWDEEHSVNWVRNAAVRVGGPGLYVSDDSTDLIFSSAKENYCYVTARSSIDEAPFILYACKSLGSLQPIFDASKRIVLDDAAPNVASVTIPANIEAVDRKPYLVIKPDSNSGDNTPVIEIVLQDRGSGIDDGSVEVFSGATLYDNFVLDSSGTQVEKKLFINLNPNQPRLDLTTLTLNVGDVAGNINTGYPVRDVLDPDLELSMIALDNDVPVVNVFWDNNTVSNGRYYNANRTATIEVNEANFDLLQAQYPDAPIATYGRDGQSSKTSVTAKEFTRRSDGLWVAQVLFDSDGDYVLEAGFSDLADRSSNVIQENFVIDTQAPTLMVTWDNNDVGLESYYKAPRTATVHVLEHNFSSELVGISTTAVNGSAPGLSGWTSDGDDYSATIYFGEETTYTLQVSATDLAGNVAEAPSPETFTIDMTMPQLDLENVVHLHAYADEIAPGVFAQDDNLSPFVTVTLSDASTQESVYRKYGTEETDTTFRQTYSDFNRDSKFDGVYRLQAKAADKAGNEATQEAVFSVNRFGSTYYFDDQSKNGIGKYLNYSPVITVVEINPSGIKQESIDVGLTFNNVARRAVKDIDYRTVPTQGAWPAQTYVFPESTFKEEGYYRLLVQSTDHAGNLNQNIMTSRGLDHEQSAEINFAVDKTAPSITYMGTFDHDVVYAPNHEVRANVVDNVALDQVTGEVNDQEVGTWGSEELTETTPLALSVDSSEAAQTVVLRAQDRAGNVSEITLSDVLVTDDAFVYWLNSPRLFYGSIIAAVAIVFIVFDVIVWRIISVRRRVRAQF